MNEYMELMATGIAKMEAKGVSEARGLYATKVASCFGCHTGAMAAAGDNKWMTV